ncbi:MobV family relaxase [Burkholderia vietnamiensis]|uniref:MobV family relaxase n=1 Tax=Burkholderia vietnamiensis TaxID=60552 RepID=UPI001FC7D93D|nr:MobV family relaxase [Burkholderia vietnamiensis]
MPSFAIARVGKIKSYGQASAAGGHNMRTRPTLNADADRTPDNVLLAGPDDLPAAIRQRLTDAGVTPGRKDAVLAAEFVLTASPEFFTDKTPQQVRAWANSQTEFLRGRYGDNLVQAVLHLDETTPHVHAAVVPITPDGRLSMKDYIGGRQNLRNLQTDYAKAMAVHGLQRGVEHSVAEHKTIKEFYGETREARRQPTPKVNIKPTVTPAPSMFMSRNAVNEHTIEQVQKYADAKNEALKPFLAERVSIRADLSRTREENRRLARTLQRERSGRIEERKAAHDNIIGLQTKAQAFDHLRHYAPAQFKVAVEVATANAKAEAEAKRARQQAEEQAKRQAQVQDQLRLQQQLERRQQHEPEPEPARRRQPTLRR